MKIKPQHLVLIGILFLGGVSGILFFNTDNIGHLFSRSVELITPEEEGADPRPAVESLDGIPSEEDASVDTAELLKELEQELLTVENDPERALEIRRRIQAIKIQQSTPPITEAGSL